jgi:hypothetical protein
MEFPNSPCQDFVNGKICWTGVHFSSVCDDTAFLKSEEKFGSE